MLGAAVLFKLLLEFFLRPLGGWHLGLLGTFIQDGLLHQ